MLFAGATFVAGAVGGLCGALHVLSCDECECDDDECGCCPCEACCCDPEGECDPGDPCSRCQDTTCEMHPDFDGSDGADVDPRVAARRSWVARMSARARAGVTIPLNHSPVSGVDCSVEPEPGPVAADEPYDWKACLDYENPDDIPGADVADGDAYF